MTVSAAKACEYNPPPPQPVSGPLPQGQCLSVVCTNVFFPVF